VARSAITDNGAQGPTLAEGAGVFATATADGALLELSIVDSTLAQNLADNRGAGIAAISVLDSEIALVLRSATISANDAPEGAGVWFFPEAGTITLDVANSALVGNTGAGPGPDCGPLGATLDSSGYNALGDLACTVAGGGTDLVAIDPLFSALTDNGGPTPTLALDEDSPLRNAGDPAGCTDADGVALATDQRGEDRHAEGICDIGAFELVP
jgi:hypothetical protein